MKPQDLDSPDLYINRELSWLEFNQRVLDEGCSDSVPLMERLKFLAIVSSNLDEFFMIRVAGLKQQLSAGIQSPDVSGLTPAQQLEAVSVRVHRLVRDQYGCIARVAAQLGAKGLRLLDMGDLSAEQTDFLESMFASEILPVLTPLAVAELDPFPALPGLSLNLAVLLNGEDPTTSQARIAVLPVPGNLPRFVRLPSREGLVFVRLEQVIRWNVRRLFPENDVLGIVEFRLTRDADVTVDEDDAADLLRAIEVAVLARRRRAVVRLEVSEKPHDLLKSWLVKWCGLSEPDVYETPGLLDAGVLMDIAANPGFDELRDAPWPAQSPRDLLGEESLWTNLQEHDALLFHPYESFDPVIELVELAGADPGVLAIKQTLYRTSGDSPIIAALARAAQNGKQVTVLVELKARFDEVRNANWARRLEDAGCHVIYGVAGLKTHAKLLLVVRREAHGIRRYVHVSTGNYNDRTARLYSDIGLITTDMDFASDASAFFNLLTGYSQEVGWTRFAVSPMGLRQRLLEMIDREMRASTVDQPGLIMAKVNSLQDPEICQELYRASQSGVKVLLNVRGICCLRPGVKDVSENITVVSIVDRFLEHARVFYFRNGGHEQVYLSSADWMKRNLDGRLEILFPVLAPTLRTRLIRALETYFADNVKARLLKPDGSWELVKRSGAVVRAQEQLYREAVDAARPDVGADLQLHPLTSPPRRDSDSRENLNP